MTQKASRLPTALDRLIQQSVDISNLYGLSRVRIVPRSIESPSRGAASVGSGVGGTDNGLPVTGGTMVGPFALGSPDDFTIIIDEDNTINVGQAEENEQYSSNLQLDDIQPNSFVLDIIAGAAFHGQELVLRTFAPSTPFTISQGTIGNGGNIQAPAGTDVSVGDLQEITFRFDESLKIGTNTGGSWRLLNTFGSGSGTGNVPDGTAQFQHLEWNSAAWIAQQTLAFGANSASSAQLNIPNDTIGLAWSNATFNGDIQLKTTIAGVLDLTRSDNTAMSFTIRAQDAVESDQTLNFTVGSGSVTTADCIIDASTAKLLIGAGGSNRITLDTTSITDLTLKSPSGITAQSAFNVTSTHVSEADSAISLSVGSGDPANTEGNLETTAALLSFSAGGAKRLTLDTLVRTDLNLVAPSGGALATFNVTSTDAIDPDNTMTMTISSGTLGVGQLESSTGFLNLIAGGATRVAIDSTTGTEITQTAFGINPVYDLFHDDTPNDNDIIGKINFSADDSSTTKALFASIFVESTDVTNTTKDATMYFSIIQNNSLTPKVTLTTDELILDDASIKLNEISLPSDPDANTGLIYLRDVAGTTTPFFLDSSGAETSMIGSGGSGTFPIRPPVDNRGNQSGAIAKNLNEETGHVLKFTLTGDATVSFSGYPANDIQQEWEVEVTQDENGEHDVTDWGIEVVNPPIIDPTPDATTVIVFRTNDNGTTVRVGNAVATAAQVGALSGLTIDVTKNWLGFGISNLGGIEMTGDIDVNAQDIFDIDRARFTLDSGVVSSSTISQILLNSSNQFQFNTENTNDFVFSFNNNIGINFEHDSVTPSRILSILSDSTNTNSIAELDITKNFATGVSGQIIGQIKFRAANDAGGELLEYAAIVGEIEDATDGTIDGSLRFETVVNNSIIPFIQINEGSSGHVDILTQLDMNTQKIINVVDPAADQDAATKKYVDDNAGTSSSIIDSNSSLTILDNAAPSRLRLILDGTPDPNIEWHPDATFYSANSANWATEYFRNTGAGVNGQFITSTTYEGNSTTSIQREYVSELTTMKTATNGAEDGKYSLGLFSKGFSKNAYVTEGGGGLINTNILHSFFGSMLLKSDQTEEEAILRLERNDTSMTVDDVSVGIVQYFGENSVGNPTIYGSTTVEASDVTSGSENGRFAVDLIDATAGFPVRMIKADSLTNTITFSPTSSIDYIFNTSGLLFPNGFVFDNTDSSTTTFDVPSGDVLSFADNETEVGKYDGNSENWIFNPDNDIQLSPTLDVDLTPSRNIIMDPTTEIRCTEDIVMFSAGATIDYTDTATVPVGSAIGAIVIRVNGTDRLVKFYST